MGDKAKGRTKGAAGSAEDATVGKTADKSGAASSRAAEREARQSANRRAREEQRAARRAERLARKARGGGAKPAGEPPAKSSPVPPPAFVPSPPPAGAKAAPVRTKPARSAARWRESAGKAQHRLLAPEFDILIVGQKGRLGVEAVLFAASLRLNSPAWRGRLIVAEPRPEGAWQGVDTLMTAPVRAALTALGAEILPFAATRFGRDYPYGNKIEALMLLPAGKPFMFFDSDTLITGELAALPLDFACPSASMRRSATWPEPPLYGPGYTAIWKSLYDRFGLDFDSSLDREQPDEHWERYLYFNAGWFLGGDAQEFGRRFLEYATAIRDEPGDELACQSLDPWLDQVALPLVIHALGGGRPPPGLDGLDGEVSCHYRNLSLLYAREAGPVLDLIEELAADPLIAPLLQGDEAVQRLIVAGEGRRILRPLFEGRDPPPPEQAIRHRLRRAGLWFR